MSAQSVAASIVAVCPHCDKKFRLPSATAGRKAKCSGCGQVFAVPALRRKDANPSAPADVIRLRCPTCEKKIKVRAAAAGKRVRCPGCQAPLLVPSVRPTAPAVPLLAPTGGGDDLLDGLDSGQAVSRPRPAAMIACVKCHTAIPAGSMICPQCGSNPTEYSVAGFSSAAGSEERSALGAFGLSMAGAGGRFLLGIVCSAGGALIGAGIWFGVAYSTQYEIGWIAWGVGALAGLGMAIGSRSYGLGTGLIAAGMSVVGIVAAKFAMFYAVFAPLLAILPGGADSPREAVIQHRTYEAMEALDPDEGGSIEEASVEEFSERFEQERQRARTIAEREVDQMSEAELMAAFREAYASDLADNDAGLSDEDADSLETEEDWDKWEAAQDKAHEEAVQKHLKELDKLGDEEVERRWREHNDQQRAAVAAGAGVLFFIVMFHWMDLIFFPLAIISAFKLGASGLEGVSGK